MVLASAWVAGRREDVPSGIELSMMAYCCRVLDFRQGGLVNFAQVEIYKKTSV